MRAGGRFQADLADPRFGALFKSQDFVIDPTDPRFKQIDGAPAIAAAVAERRSAKRKSSAPAAAAAAAGEQQPEQPGQWLRTLCPKPSGIIDLLKYP